jgi:hypothetical protein
MCSPRMDARPIKPSIYDACNVHAATLYVNGVPAASGISAVRRAGGPPKFIELFRLIPIAAR